jgi:hypothetical protein
MEVFRFGFFGTECIAPGRLNHPKFTRRAVTSLPLGLAPGGGGGA